MKSLIDICDLTREEIAEMITVAEDIIRRPAKYAKKCKGKKIATLFFEPSTRTRLSFEAAMYELGGNVLPVPGEALSSAAKGESIADTVRVISSYADIIAMRSPKEGAAFVAARSANVPIINAGDGGHCHPTQTLADLLTIYREKGTFDNLTVGFCGDLKYGRTVHSLITALSRYNNVKIVLISPKELILPNYVKIGVIEKSGMEYYETDDLEKAIPDLDILYMTRIQRERFEDKSEYDRLKDAYVLTEEKMKAAKKDACVMHPLPRVNEISVKVDDDPRACYFKQVENGKYIRMALILKLLQEAKNSVKEDLLAGKEVFVGETGCENPRCISQTEQELAKLFKVVDKEANVCRCVYCEKRKRF
ncbi:MAG: aspartate carbamoyltransferase [Clostridia bacterium]|nr:aspartate carbamoyltransferase [Clostridia bacterium]MBR5987560.1 aspartate carbamoyltransferase [Clostridia bacterium]